MPAPDEMLPKRYQYLALTAFDQALITEGQLAHFLRLDRLDTRRTIEILRESTNGMVDIGTTIETSGA
jgi:hypothetical protein